MSTQTASVSLDLEYLKSKHGLLRIGEALIGLCGIICVSEGYCNYDGMGGFYNFYNFVVVTSFILSLIILIVYGFGIDKICTFVNCSLLVFINDVLFAILYLVATILMIVTIGACRYEVTARVFAALFGMCGTVVLCLLALFGYQVMKESGNHNNYESIPESDPA